MCKRFLAFRIKEFKKDYYSAKKRYYKRYYKLYPDGGPPSLKKIFYVLRTGNYK